MGESHDKSRRSENKRVNLCILGTSAAALPPSSPSFCFEQKVLSTFLFCSRACKLHVQLCLHGVPFPSFTEWAYLCYSYAISKAAVEIPVLTREETGHHELSRKPPFLCQLHKAMWRCLHTWWSVVSLCGSRIRASPLPILRAEHGICQWVGTPQICMQFVNW